MPMRRRRCATANGSISRSRARLDLVHWQHLGDALPDKPGWARDTQDFWAPYVVQRRRPLPHVLFGDARRLRRARARPLPGHRHRDLAGRAVRRHGHAAAARHGLRIYRPDGVRRSGQRQAASSIGDRVSSRSRSRSWREDRMAFAPASEPVDLVWPNPVKGAFPRLVEAAWVIHHDDYYYLFYSGDNCCGPDAEYGVMVARSREPTGPFETLEEARGVPHSLMLFKSERWLAPGHNCDRHRQGRRGLDRLPCDRREPPAPAPGGRDQQPPDPADRPDRMARRLALRRHARPMSRRARRPSSSTRQPQPSGSLAPLPVDSEDRPLPLQFLAKRLIDMALAVRTDASTAARHGNAGYCPSRDKQ